MVDDLASGGWEAIRPESTEWVLRPKIDPFLPEADWFWLSLERHCVAGCCGIDAFDFSAESVAWACGWGTIMPSYNPWRDDVPGDSAQLARDLRKAAQQIRKLEVDALDSLLFGDVLTRESYALLLEDLAAKALPKP
ncbi:MAG TPA: hypothetical protein DCR14_17725 [Acidimicrobiaceae bacterium]|nr:hypothetical protein [Acidimicrobiaceae bacterium]